MLAELGGTVIDADVLARRATEPGRSTLPLIRERFGDAVFDADGDLDRAAMAAVVFEDADALRDLEQIVHPEVRGARRGGAEEGNGGRRAVRRDRGDQAGRGWIWPPGATKSGWWNVGRRLSARDLLARGEAADDAERRTSRRRVRTWLDRLERDLLKPRAAKPGRPTRSPSVHGRVTRRHGRGRRGPPGARRF